MNCETLISYFDKSPICKKISEHLKNPITQFDYQNEIENLKEQIEFLKDYYLWECGKYSNECRKVRISEKVKSIDPIGNDGPFENCSHITHIFIPNTVTSICYCFGIE